MATLQNFDAEIAKTKQVVEEMRSKIDQSATVLDKFAKTDAKIGSADFDIENGVLYTNEPEAVLLYTVDVVDSTKFSAMFTTTLGMLMASYLAGPIIKGDAGAKTAVQWRSAAMNFADTAAARDARGSSDTDTFIPSHLAARS